MFKVAAAVKGVSMGMFGMAALVVVSVIAIVVLPLMLAKKLQHNIQ